MIQKKNNNYETIKDNIVYIYALNKMVSIDLVTDGIDLKYICSLFTNEDINSVELTSSFNYAQKFFRNPKKEIEKHFQRLDENKEHLKDKLVSTTLKSFINTYLQSEFSLSNDLSKDFIAKNPLSDCETKSDRARRNQKLGQFTRKFDIGSITHYEFFKDFPNSYQDKKDILISLNQILDCIKLLISNNTLKEEVNKLILDLKLENVLVNDEPKTVKAKVVKI